MRRWEGPMVFEGEETGDDRTLTPGSLSWNVPIPLNLTHAEEAPTVGVINTLERLPDGSVWGTGVFLDTVDGLRVQQECEAAQAAGMTWGVSVDLDSVSMDLRVRPEALADMGVIDGEESPGAEPAAEPMDDAGRVTIASYNQGDFMTVVTAARIRAASLVSIPAFYKAYVRVLAEVGTDTAAMDARVAYEAAKMAEFTEKNQGLSLVASGFPLAPPTSWFDNPSFECETPIEVDDNGYIRGHAAPWGMFHIGFAGQRIEAPRSMANYAYFRVGQIRTAEGTDIAIGTITMGTGHAGDDLSSASTLAHYENTGNVVADVVCGEDDFGIWVAGALRPSVTDEQVRALRAAPMSGDWREIRGNLELVALLAVNTPGFMVPRMSALVAGGEVRSLVASAAYGVPEPVEETIQLTREEKLAIREMVAQRLAQQDSQEALEGDQPVSDDGNPESPGAIEGLPDDESPGAPDDGPDTLEETLGDRANRAAAAIKTFRAERAKTRAATRVKGN